MNIRKAARRPAIHLIDDQAETLTNLALAAEHRLPEVAELLLQEIERATLHGSNALPARIVSMNCLVEFVDAASGSSRTVQLVYPGEADITGNRISILTPVGAGLIGMRQGQSILWPDRDGHDRKLTIVKVISPHARPVDAAECVTGTG
ncbi:regulator of nucleoside diphosphate kinase [Novosphingobium sp. PhB165]|nr:nucleoside diphosphate kinase regulator [Novosphingobium sp. PhB165]TCM20376.1 regulator of nucleoside diphosphate kinase [Novosphingobium sp. PhB165]